ncbi:DNA N-6-adenine-methyltransferase [Sphingomonas panaciterrae]|uniref:DNA N-6-adenine-methyltransferase n=1 Tax=Sphingomonas panaciterrae TaxID=1462999 RepID=UPI002FEEECDA
MLIEDLRSARRSKGLSRLELAARAGVDPQVVKRLEAGVGTMPTLVAVMKALDYHLSGVARGADLPAQLRQRRRTLRLSLEQAAARAGIARGTVSNLEQGEGSVRSALRLLEALAPKARRRAPERAHWLFDPNGGRDTRFTPPEFMDAVYAAFGEVDLDPCGHVESPVRAKRRILIEEGGDGLSDEWSGRLTFMNPPFSAMLKWLRRAEEQWRSGRVQTIVSLVPARTDSAWFHDHLRLHADIYMLRGRIRFLSSKGRGDQTPFSLMVVIFGGEDAAKQRFAELIPGFWLPRSD